MRLVFLLVLLFPLTLHAQTDGKPVRLKDSLGFYIRQGWVFADGDDPARAAPGFDDNAWQRLDPWMIDPKKTPFTGIGWFRLHVTADSATIAKPLSIELEHNGASEVYLDGKKIFSRGTIRGPRSSIYVDPHSVPVPVIIRDTGRHVLAVRYANWAGLSGRFIYRDEPLGFRLKFDQAEKAVMSAWAEIAGNSGILMLLAGIFGALFFVHLLFFLYTPADKSNLWFSSFNLCISLLFIAPYLTNLLTRPETNLYISSLSLLFLLGACYSISGFLNALFSKTKVRLYIAAALCALCAVTYFWMPDYAGSATMSLVGLISLEAIFLIGRAVYRKVPGAMIIGAGLILLIILLLIIVVCAALGTGIHVKGGDAAGVIVAILLALTVLSIPVSLSAYLARRFWALTRDLKLQLTQVQQLSAKALEHETEKQRLLEDRQESLEREVALRTAEIGRQKAEIEEQHLALKVEKKKADDLLRNILPEEVAEELKEHGTSAARLYEHVTVLFTDFADFTQRSEQMSPEALVAEIDECFKAFDGIIEQYGLEKIKTVGDAYIAVAGLPVLHERHAQAVVEAALAIRDFMEARRKANESTFRIRLGVHSGPVVAGIVGVKKFAYDIWGDTVNKAARMEQHGEVGRVNISQETCALLRDEFACTYRGELEAKHKGRLGMYFVDRAELRVENSFDATTA